MPFYFIIMSLKRPFICTILVKCFCTAFDVWSFWITSCYCDLSQTKALGPMCVLA